MEASSSNTERGVLGRSAGICDPPDHRSNNILNRWWERSHKGRFDNTVISAVGSGAFFTHYQKVWARALIVGMNEKQNNPQPLKDLIIRGAFFVILLYILVYIYNSGIINR